MIKFTRRKLLGKWTEGFSLDLHTLSSDFIGYESGYPRFNNRRSEIGELLYNLKSRSDYGAVPEIVEAVETLMKEWRPPVDILVPVPPSSRHRDVQPVFLLAKAISPRLEIPLADCVAKARNVPELKNTFDLNERAKLLENLYTIDKSVTQGKSILLFDDLYRSGATMNAITAELYETGKATKVFAITITKTRTHQ